MKRILIFANTYYQMIFAAQLKKTILKDDYVEIILSDRSNGMEEIVKKIKQTGVFENCQYIRIKNCDQHISFGRKILDCIDISLRGNNRYNIYLKGINSKYFDEFLFFNSDIEIEGIYSILLKYNKNIAISLFEEGMLNYPLDIIPTQREKAISVLKIMLHKPCLCNQKFHFYCFYPQLYYGKGIAIKVPLIARNSSVSSFLSKIFEPDLNIYKQRYIFFTSVYDFEGGNPVGEYGLVCKIAELVGKDNLLVKTHPRDTRTIYTENGFNVDKNSSIPWEAIQLIGDFSDKIFLTINSGSVLSGSTMSEKPVRTYYMYKLCDISGNEACKKNAQDIERLLQNDSTKEILRNVKIADNLEDIL